MGAHAIKQGRVKMRKAQEILGDAAEFDHRVRGGLSDVDGLSRSLAGGSARPFEPGPLLWPLACVVGVPG
jgi:hypothetical protein